MHLLAYNDTVRVAVVVAGTATVYDLKEKIAKQTTKPSGKTEWPADAISLSLNGEMLADEMSLVECCVKDRDRLLISRTVRIALKDVRDSLLASLRCMIDVSCCSLGLTPTLVAHQRRSSRCSLP